MLDMRVCVTFIELVCNEPDFNQPLSSRSLERVERAVYFFYILKRGQGVI